MSTLYIFDFDDTLAMTDSHVRVIRSSGQVDRLDSRQFANYRSAPGDELDFSEFTRASGSLIDSTVQEMQSAIQQYGIDNVYIVTARAEGEPVFEFLSSFGMNVPEVVATAGSAGKGPWLIRKLLVSDYSQVIVYEDCRKNIKMLKDTVEAYNEELGEELGQNVQYSAICILPDGSQELIESKIRNLIRGILLSL